MVCLFFLHILKNCSSYIVTSTVINNVRYEQYGAAYYAQQRELLAHQQTENSAAAASAASSSDPSAAPIESTATQVSSITSSSSFSTASLSSAASSSATPDANEPSKKMKKRKSKKGESTATGGGDAATAAAKAQAAAPAPPAWFELDDTHNMHVYVSGLPLDTTDEEFVSIMKTYGLVMHDPLTHKPKVKLYRDAAGHFKGDGLACYIKVPPYRSASVPLLLFT